MTMWKVERIEKRKGELDFSSSGQGVRAFDQIFFDDVQFANAMELTRWDAGSFQVLVCEQCGHAHCAHGAWFLLRRAGDFAIFLPDAAAMSQGEREREEYSPPWYVAAQGIPVLETTRYESLRGLIRQLPAFKALQPLVGAEAVGLLAWEAPRAALERPLLPVRVRRDLIIAVSEGELSERVERLADLLENLGVCDGPCILVPASPGDRVVTFYLDHPDSPEWPALALRGGQAALFFRPGLIVMPT